MTKLSSVNIPLIDPDAIAPENPEFAARAARLESITSGRLRQRLTYSKEYNHRDGLS
jgi:hypothetical protein